jgi:hypothetical protein
VNWIKAKTAEVSSTGISGVPNAPKRSMGDQQDDRQTIDWISTSRESCHPVKNPSRSSSDIWRSKTTKRYWLLACAIVKSTACVCVFSRRKADLRRHVECVQFAAALLFDRQRTLRTESGSKLHALHMKEPAKHIRLSHPLRVPKSAFEIAFGVDFHDPIPRILLSVSVRHNGTGILPVNT